MARGGSALRLGLGCGGLAGLAFLTNIPVAQAYPPGFPDLDAFTAADPATYTHAYNYGRGSSGVSVAFRTPDGVYCRWEQYADATAHPDFSCIGNIPGVPQTVTGQDRPGCTVLDFQTHLAGSSGLFTFTHLDPQYNRCPGPEDTSPLLPAGSKVSASNVTCAVADDDETACIDPIVNRGFVLTPQGSWVF